MSFANDGDFYKKVISEEKASTMSGSSTEFLVVPKCEEMDETLVVGEEIIVDENIDIDSEGNICKQEDDSEYFDDSMDTTMSIEYAEAEDSASLSSDNITEKKWYSRYKEEDYMISDSEESESESDKKLMTDDQDSDEETIATFVTSSGQQLALYAVEDLEDIFAVAVYDESDEPPTNFQFLMKADVERLIGEGAVRTVKKPIHFKKQLLTTQSPIFSHKSQSTNDIDISNRNENNITLNKNERTQENETPFEEDSSVIKDLKPKRISNVIYTTGETQSDVTYLMMDDCSINMVNSGDYENYEEKDESDGELVEQSTVQYILYENDQSDSELTFDEIHRTLQNLKSNAAKKQTNKQIVKDESNFSVIKDIENSNMFNQISSISSKRKLNLSDSQRELLEALEDPPTDLMPSDPIVNVPNGSIECTSPESSQIQCKTKRPRKQQLISVNREDSEIIIQPASLLNEEDNTPKKKTRRNRRVVTHSRYRQRNHDLKRMKRIKRKEVEIIEIDIDEEESIQQSKRNVVEITIDDNKDKYSSDKENEIIMVGDSDEESQQSKSKGILQCQHCSRNFRQQRLLETHLRVCSKSPANAMRYNEQKLKQANGTTENTVKKQYPCKICQEKFDVVVALARHVRSAHPQRKKRRFSKSSERSSTIEVKEKKERVEPKKQLTIIRKARRKRNQRPTCTWETKKLNCSDCGRWFPSAALLRAHCLQHGTKKSEQVRKCQICQKLIRSRLLFIQHLKKHRNSQTKTKRISNIQKKLHTTRSVTSKITALRKRGRSRKF